MRGANLFWSLAVVAAGIFGYMLGTADRQPPTRATRGPAVPVSVPLPSTDWPSPELEKGHAECRPSGEDAQPDVVPTTPERKRLLREAEARKRERDLLMQAPKDDLRTLLRLIGQRRARVPELVADGDTMRARTARTAAAGPLLSGAHLAADEPLPEGATVRFPAGVFQLDTAAWNKAFPAGLLVEGAGMDATLLRLDQAIEPGSNARDLTMRELTIDCRNHYFVDTNDSEPFVVRLDRVRVVGFDSGTGRSVMFKVRHGALYATGCKFEGGYGGRPGSGTLFRVNQALLVRMEDCTIRGPFARLFDIDAGATYHFVRCAFGDLAAGERGLPEGPLGGVQFEACRFDFVAAGATAQARSLKAVQPAWGR
ncbi:MAG: hypothetical protein O7C98_15895 [Planctomycetota bacterium]|nr:hypothetical protein [Planctomycetota bacterium]